MKQVIKKIAAAGRKAGRKLDATVTERRYWAQKDPVKRKIIGSEHSNRVWRSTYRDQFGVGALWKQNRKLRKEVTDHVNKRNITKAEKKRIIKANKHRWNARALKKKNKEFIIREARNKRAAAIDWAKKGSKS